MQAHRSSLQSRFHIRYVISFSSWNFPNVVVGGGVQVWAAWRPGVPVSEVWAVLAEPFVLFS